MKFVFYAEPLDPFQQPKAFSDKNSEEARWVSIEEFVEIAKKQPFMRGNELIQYGNYI